MGNTKVHQYIETPTGTFESTPKGLALLSPCSQVSSENTKLLSIFYEKAKKVIEAPFVIETFARDTRKGQWNVKLLFENGSEQNLEIAFQDIDDEIALKRAIQTSFTESIGYSVPTHEDGYTRAITHFYTNEKIDEADFLKNWKWNQPRPRIVVEKGLIHLTLGFSRIEVIFRRIFQPEKMRQWENQNRRAIVSYLSFLQREIGLEKLDQIQCTYGFDLRKMYEKGEPLRPKHIYLCNIGMNNIEMSDVLSLENRLQMFLSEHEDSEKLETILRRERHPFTLREGRAILKTLGKDATISDLKVYLSTGSERFANLVKLLETPKEAWDKLYTGRKFNAAIKGGYNKDVSDRRTFRPWVDQQELLQVFNELKDPFPGETVDRKKLDHYFFEMVVKVVVKKHLMRSENDGTWRVGALIPSPYKDAQGNTVYYRVDQGVDSGHGKLWYVLRPACDDCDPSLPVIRAPRDTTRDHYAQRGGPTIARDLAVNAGYRYSSTTHKEDAAFFKEFTLPVWMGVFYVAMKASKRDQSKLKPLLKELHTSLQVEIHKRIMENRMDQGKGEKALAELSEIYSLFNSSDETHQLKYAKLYFATIFQFAPYEMDDYHRLTRLMKGERPRPLASIGNSLGGFDAQNDLIRNTLISNRIPITNLELYTHSTLKIDQRDDHLFTNFILVNKGLLNALNVKLTIRHVTEFGDPVSLATQGTFLGRMLQVASEEDRVRDRPFPVDVSIGVFKPNPYSSHPEVTELTTHHRRIERLEEGVDYVFLQDYESIAAYDEFGRNFKFKGRLIEDWRKTLQDLNFHDFSDRIWRTWRKRLGTVHKIPKPFANYKLTVNYTPDGSSRFNFAPIEQPLYSDKPKLRFIIV